MGGSINQNVLDGFEIDYPLERMLAFAHERQQIFYRKEAGLPRPWTTDETLDKYKFCNIFRDQDKTTKWIVDWVTPMTDPCEKLTTLIYARMCNNPDVLSRTGWIGAVIPSYFVQIIDQIGGGKTAAKTNKNTVWKDPYQIAGAFKTKLGYDNREQLIAYHLPKVREQLFEVVKANAGSEDLTETLDQMAEVWGYRMNMVFTHALLDYSYFYPHIVNPNASYPMGDGATPILKILKDITLDELVNEWNTRFPHERKMLRCDAEGMLCEWRKYLVWSNGLAKKYRLYRKE